MYPQNNIINLLRMEYITQRNTHRTENYQRADSTSWFIMPFYTFTISTRKMFLLSRIGMFERVKIEKQTVDFDRTKGWYISKTPVCIYMQHSTIYTYYPWMFRGKRFFSTQTLAVSYIYRNDLYLCLVCVYNTQNVLTIHFLLRITFKVETRKAFDSIRKRHAKERTVCERKSQNRRILLCFLLHHHLRFPFFFCV